MTSFGFWLLLIAVWVYVAGSTLAAWRFARRPAVKTTGNPPVSMLKPLHGTEPGLYENLRSFAEQDFPVYQLVLGVRDHMDAALPIARALIRDLPGCDIRLVVDPRVGGSNLKVANLENMLPAARHDVIVLADSDMRVTPDYLRTVTAPLADPATGIVTCPYKGAATDEGLWSKLAALHINFGFLPGALAGDSLDVGGGCFGATIAVRRHVLERIGGFARLRNELADDHRMGSAVRRLGLTAVLSRYIVENRVSEPSLASLWRHELRWARTSWAMAPAGFAGSIVTHTTALALIGALLAGSGTAWMCALLSLLLRWGSAIALARRVGLPTAGMWLLPVRDALSFAVFLASFCGRNVSWRDQSFRVEPNGRMRIEGDKAA
jgi:ceramide glucosyltransferase